jgi:hypothetical protein
MGSVIIGTNKITNCQVVIGLKEQSLLQVTFSPLRVSLRLPPGLPSKISFEIADNAIKGEGLTLQPELRVVSGAKNVSIFWNNLLLLSATLLDEETAHLKIDLRPIGIAVFDDPEGLHIGKSLMARSSFANCMTAISLG